MKTFILNPDTWYSGIWIFIVSTFVAIGFDAPAGWCWIYASMSCICLLGWFNTKDEQKRERLNKYLSWMTRKF